MTNAPQSIHGKGCSSPLRGTRHLRVGIEIGPAPARVVSVWLVEQPTVQHVDLVDPIIARIDIGGRAALVESVTDPRVIRGTYRDDRGHAFIATGTGTLYVSVPFDAAVELSDVRIRVADFEGVDVVREPAPLSAAFDEPPAGMRLLGTVTTADIERHPDWEAVAQALGFDVPPGCFEIDMGEDGCFYWYLRRRDGRIVAWSATGYEQREACEQDLRWVRERAPACHVVSRDVGGSGGRNDSSC